MKNRYRNIFYFVLFHFCYGELDFTYHNYDQVTSLFHKYETDYPDLCKVYSIGTSVQGRELWVLQITQDVNDIPKLRPSVKWVANMHGDETIGRELTLQMAQFLLQNQLDERVSSFLKRIDLHLVPSLNPDGFEMSREGSCRSSHRSNADGVDLNRNFPDQFRDKEWATDRIMSNDRYGKPTKLAAETEAIIKWIENSNFVLSLNLHAGSVVASYPFDDNEHFNTISSHSYSKSPDDDFFKFLAQTYADNHAFMFKMDGKACGDNEPTFHKGITNGADWYQVPGGMEDYNYLYGDCFEITIELTCCKYPEASKLKDEWENNKNALWEYTMAAYQGVHGFVMDHNGNYLEKASISVGGIDKTIHSNKNGAFWRLLLPGEYTIEVAAEGYETVKSKIDLKEDTLFKNFTVFEKMKTVSQPVDPWISGRAEDPALEGINFVHHDYQSLTNLLENVAEKFPHICKLTSIGQSEELREIWAMEISDNPGHKELLEPEFKYVANMHGNEVKGREVAIVLIQYLLNNYGKKPRIKKMVDNTRIFVIPSLNPDGNQKSFSILRDGTNLRAVAQVKFDSMGRENSKGVDLNRDFPDHFHPISGNPRAKETRLIMEWMMNHHFTLSLNSHGGALVANYPLDDSPQLPKSLGRRSARSVDVTRTKRGVHSSPSVSPDDDVFKKLATTYATNHKTMFLGKSCENDLIGRAENEQQTLKYGTERFDGGIVNGQVWYPVAGGMQDWNYWQTSAFEVTVEIGCIKFPDKKYLKQYWEANSESTLRFIELSKMGINGVVFDHQGKPISDAFVTIIGREAKIVKTSELGDFFRPLLPGKYRMEISKPGHLDFHDQIEVPESGSVQMNFTLQSFGDEYMESTTSSPGIPSSDDFDLNAIESLQDSQGEKSNESEIETALDEPIPPQQPMTEDLFDTVEVGEVVSEVENELSAIPGETPAKDDSNESTKATTSTSTSTTTTTTTTMPTTSTLTDVDISNSPPESVTFESVSDDSLLAADNLDVLADEVGEEIGEFEYGLENESLPKPPTPQELRKAIVNEETKKYEDDNFDGSDFMKTTPNDESFIGRYVFIIFFAVVALLGGRIWYVRRKSAQVGFGGFGGIPKDLSTNQERQRLTTNQNEDDEDVLYRQREF